MEKNKKIPHINLDYFEDLTGDIKNGEKGDVDEVGKRIQQLREERGVSIDDLSNLTGFDVARLENIERHLMVLLSSLIVNVQVDHAVHYVINPMTESPSELIKLSRRIETIKKLIEEELNSKIEFDVHVIPLIEDFSTMIKIDELLKDWINYLLSLEKYDYIRIMIGKSDTAMLYGHVTSILGIKIALSKIWKITQELKIRTYPIIGVGKLPFRGNLSPNAVREFADTYKWFYTVTIQSGIRFDMGVQAVRSVLSELSSLIGRKPREYDIEEIELILKTCKIMTREYLKFIVRICDKILMINNFIPKRRERLEVAKYSRSLIESAYFTEDTEIINIVEDRNPVLPRAINFVAALYTMGIAPTIIGFGRGLKQIEKELGQDVVEFLLREIQPIIIKDLEFDLALLDLDVVRKYMGERPFKLIYEDFEEIKNRFRIEPISEPWVEKHKELIRLFNKYFGKEECIKYLTDAGILRGSLG